MVGAGVGAGAFEGVVFGWPPAPGGIFGIEMIGMRATPTGRCCNVSASARPSSRSAGGGEGVNAGRCSPDASIEATVWLPSAPISPGTGPIAGRPPDTGRRGLEGGGHDIGGLVSIHGACRP